MRMGGTDQHSKKGRGAPDGSKRWKSGEHRDKQRLQNSDSKGYRLGDNNDSQRHPKRESRGYRLGGNSSVPIRMARLSSDEVRLFVLC